FLAEADGPVRMESSYRPFTLYPLVNARQPNPSREEPAGPFPLPEPFRSASETEAPQQPAQQWPWLITALVLALLGIGVLAGVIQISGFRPSRPCLNWPAAASARRAA